MRFLKVSGVKSDESEHFVKRKLRQPCFFID